MKSKGMQLIMKGMKSLVIVVWFFIVIGIVVNNVYGELPLNYSNLSGNGNNMAEDMRVEAEKKADEEHEKSVGMEPEVIAIYGKLPELKTEKQRLDWYKDQEAIVKDLRDNINLYYYPAGPIISHGRHVDGYFVVAIYKELKVDKPLLDEIYGLFDEEAKKNDIHEVPVRFILEDFAQLDMEIVDSKEDVSASEEIDNDVSPPDNTTDKRVTGFGLLGGCISLFSGWLFRRK